MKKKLGLNSHNDTKLFDPIYSDLLNQLLNCMRVHFEDNNKLTS